MNANTTVSLQDPIILAGRPRDEEIAAVIVTLAALTAPTPTAVASPPEDGWGAPVHLLRHGLFSPPSTFVNAHLAR